MSAPFDLDAAADFAVFADHLNFTRAAEALHLSQPALHAKVKKLEAELGVPLYKKRGRALELTDTGRELARLGRDLRAQASDLLQTIRGGAPREPVTLAAGEGSFLYLLGDPLRRYLKRPPAPLRLLTRDRDGALLAVREGVAGLGVSALDVLPDDLEHDLIGRYPQVLVCPAGHDLADRKQLRLRDLEGQALVVPPPDRPHRQSLARALLAAGIGWQPAVEAQGWELALHFVRLGVGLAVVSGICRPGRGLVARPLPELPATSYYAFCRRGLPAASPVRALRQAIAESLAPDR
jgi:DNA-binding transcriptional LysR family regulator